MAKIMMPGRTVTMMNPVLVKPELFIAHTLATQPAKPAVTMQKFLFIDKINISKQLFQNINTQTYPVIYNATDILHIDNKNPGLYWYLPEYVIEENSLNFESEPDLDSNGNAKQNAEGQQLYKANVSFSVQKIMPSAVTGKLEEIRKATPQATIKEIPFIGGAITANFKSKIYGDNGVATDYNFNPVLKAITGNKYEFMFDLPFQGLKIAYNALKGSADNNTLTIAGTYMAIEKPKAFKFELFQQSAQLQMAPKMSGAMGISKQVIIPIIVKPATTTGNPPPADTVKVKSFIQAVAKVSFPCNIYPSAYKVKNPVTLGFTAVGCTVPWSNSLQKFSDLQLVPALTASLTEFGIKEAYLSTLENKQFTIVPRQYSLAWVFAGETVDETKATAGAFLNLASDLSTNTALMQLDFIMAPAINATQMQQIRYKIFQYATTALQVKIDNPDEIIIRFPEKINDAFVNYSFLSSSMGGTTTVCYSGNYLFGPGECFKVSLLLDTLVLAPIIINSLKNFSLGLTSNVSFKLNDFINTDSIFNIKLNRLTGDAVNYTPENPVGEITIENKSNLNLMLESIQLIKTVAEYKEIKIDLPLLVNNKTTVNISSALFQPAKWNIVAKVMDSADKIMQEQIADIAQEAKQEVTFLVGDSTWFALHNVISIELSYELQQSGSGVKTCLLTPAASSVLVSITMPLIKYVFNRKLSVNIKINQSNGTPPKIITQVYDLNENSFLNVINDVVL